MGPKVARISLDQSASTLSINVASHEHLNHAIRCVYLCPKNHFHRFAVGLLCFRRQYSAWVSSSLLMFTLISSDGLLGDLKNALPERILDVEMDVHLESPAQKAAGNHRHGHGRKTVLSDDGAVELSVLRD